MLADHVEKNGLEGKLKYTLFVGASSGAETENRWAALNMIERRSPHQVGKSIAKGINNGQIKFFDKHLSMFPVDLVYVGAPLSQCLRCGWKFCCSNLSRKFWVLINILQEYMLILLRDSIPRIGRTRNWM